MGSSSKSMNLPPNWKIFTGEIYGFLMIFDFLPWPGRNLGPMVSGKLGHGF